MENKVYRVEVSSDAFLMLDTHAGFLARVSASAARQMIEHILDDITTLANMPERNPFYDHEQIPVGRYRKMLSAKRYLIVYEIESNGVYVDYIIDCRQETVI